jgi:AcrR family transcriptional regulator
MKEETGRAPRSTKGSQTRARILEAARRVVAEEGIVRFTTRRVAAEAAISHGMCHYHFRDKLDLVRALITHSRRDWIEPLEKLVGGAGTAQARARAVIAWMAEPATTEVMRVHQELFSLALRDETVRAELAGEYELWRGPFVELFQALAVEEGLPDLDARGVGESFAAAADGLVQQQALDPDLPTERLLTSLFDEIMRGARAR